MTDELLSKYKKFESQQGIASSPNFEQPQTFAPEQKELTRKCVTEGFPCLLKFNDKWKMMIEIYNCSTIIFHLLH